MCYVTQIVGRAFELKRIDAVDGLDQIDTFVNLPHCAFDFRMAGVADHDDFLAVVVKLDDLTVHFGDQGTRGVENAQRAGMRFVRDAAGNAVG